MARKVLPSRASRTETQKSVKRTEKPATPSVKRPAAKTVKPAPAKTLKRPAVPEKKPAVVLKKPGVAEKKPAITDKKMAGSDKPVLGKKGVAAVKTSASPGAAKVVTPKVKKPRAKKAPPRMRVRWCVYDGMMKPVAMFDYNRRKEAEASLAQFLQKKPTYFLQTVKEPMPPEPEVPQAR